MSVDETIAALSNPTRRELIRRLARKPCRAGEIAGGFPVSRPAIYKHTRLLRHAGLIRAKKKGREQIYELAPRGGQAVKDLIAQLERIGRFWSVALVAFKRYVEERE